ncbi:MAG: hypothetical protein IJP86_12450 [Synergistaceae bacterium]|nr:hypothetical protein [Synergistaceae bacterium]
MRKFLCALFLLLTGTAFADVMPPYVIIGNAGSVSGGNDAVYVSENAGENLGGSPVPDITITSPLRSTLPITRGNVPSRQNSLLNPNEPVEITARGSYVTVSDWGGDDVYSVRVFDSSGEPLETSPDEDGGRHPVTISLTPQPRDFYLEIMQKDMKYDTDSEPEFCYVLLRMKSGRDSAITKPETIPAASGDRAVKSRSGNPFEAIGEIYRRYRREAESNPY